MRASSVSGFLRTLLVTAVLAPVAAAYDTDRPPQRLPAFGVAADFGLATVNLQI